MKSCLVEKKIEVACAFGESLLELGEFLELGRDDLGAAEDEALVSLALSHAGQHRFFRVARLHVPFLHQLVQRLQSCVLRLYLYVAGAILSLFVC